MDKEQEQEFKNDQNLDDNKTENQELKKSETKDKDEKKEITPEEKIIELEDKLARTFA